MRYMSTRKVRIEIIPMIDIMLFLLVFFAMLTLRMIPSSGHVTKLPTSSTATIIPHPKLLVEIGRDGSLLVENAGGEFYTRPAPGGKFRMVADNGRLRRKLQVGSLLK